MVPDHTLPSPDDLAAAIRAARAARRAVALHCVTREALALIIAALTETGTVPGDRLEHCAVASPDALEFLARHDLRVITQPSLPAARGDDYLARVDPEDLPDLWRYAGFLRAGVRVAPSSDAPYGGLDPWAAMAAARDRATPSGLVLGPAERVPARTVLDGALSHPLDPGGPPARLAVGAPADLVLLRVPLARALREPDSSLVALTVIEGRIAYEAAP
ncbi:amidohydrolase family protein [Thermocatellispora tengchongensis]|uniref:amidohydrolase family protein n=1 Tax=Thermocatellispora tengchongensis TaxID=1073253 RepID=UPI00363A47F8